MASHIYTSTGVFNALSGSKRAAEGNDLAKVFPLCHRGQALSPPGATDPSGNLLTLKGALLRTALDAENKMRRKPAMLLLTVITQRELEAHGNPVSQGR